VGVSYIKLDLDRDVRGFCDVQVVFRESGKLLDQVMNCQLLILRFFFP